MSQRRTTIWGWGFEDEQPTPEQKKAIAKGIVDSLGKSEVELDPEPRVEDIELRASRISPPASLARASPSSAPILWPSAGRGAIVPPWSSTRPRRPWRAAR